MKKIISGKVREVYEVDEKSLAIVTTDRISAFDVILGSEIPGKGIALNQISDFWFDLTKDILPNHIISTSAKDFPAEFQADLPYYEKRTVLVKKLKMLPYEFIVRGYVFGSMWSAYQKGEEFCGQKIEGDYQQAEALSEPIVTPSIKAKEGHDVYISIEELEKDLGEELANQLCEASLALYKRCYEYAKERGVIIADTKFEFGFDENGVLTVGDEIFTPDSSRFWDAAAYKVGESPKSYDKQFVRDWLIAEGKNGVEPAPQLPAGVTENTARIYRECYQKLTGKEL